jgi:hypothetical protein
MTVEFLIAVMAAKLSLFKLKADDMFSGNSDLQLLDEMSQRTDTLLAHISEHLHEQAGFMREGSERLLRRRGKVYFVRSTDNHVASTQGNEIRVCLKGKPDADLLFAVVCHELAHMMERPDDRRMGANKHSVHSQRFKNDERWLIRLASRLGLTSQASHIGRTFCGIQLPDPMNST